MTRYVLVCALVLYTLVRSVQVNRNLIGSNLGYVPALAIQAAPYLKPGTVCARKPHIVWYLNEQVSHFPAFTHVPMPMKDILNTLRKDRIDYIFLSGIEWKLRPETRPWFDPRKAPPDFVLMASVQQPPVFLYGIDHTKSPPPAP
jgi:hypothetical protein